MEILQIIKNSNNRYIGDLIYYYKKIMKAPNAHAHYHNIRHMLHVLWESYDGGVHMGLSPKDLRNLLISSLYHDFDHTGKKNEGGDRQNINRALVAIRRDILPEDKDNLPEIELMISSTEFPYSSDIISLQSKILRDSDMSQTFSDVWIQSILFDLGKELEMSYESMLKMQIPFMKNQKFYTEWGINKFGHYKEKRLLTITEMIDLLD